MPGPLVGPVRTCVGCRQRGQRSVLLRVVRDDDGDLAVVDPGRCRSGRGAWLHPDPECLDLAERRRALPRALRTGPLDITPVREHLETLTSSSTERPAVPTPAVPPSFIEKESGLEADGHPMSTRR
nr:YlxR family protein [Actinotalea sp. JY-7876]